MLDQADHEYYAARAEEERERARLANDEESAAIHAKLAYRYERLAADEQRIEVAPSVRQEE